MTEVVANEMVLLGGPGGGQGSGGGFQKKSTNNDFDQRAPEPEHAPAGDNTGITDEDIPF
jgi:single-stranded DNA-binding protein